MDKIRRHLKKVSWLSLDVFDTALFRKVDHPTDIFKRMEAKVTSILGESSTGFASLRVIAEKEARINQAQSGEITLSDIYKALGVRLRLSEEQQQYLRELEIETERKFIYGNPRILELYIEAQQMGKSIFFLSDMYLPSSKIASFLTGAGYANPQVFVSSEQGCNKGTGKLYRKISDQLKISRGDVLHVGDNFRADYVRARLSGWRAVHVPAYRGRHPELGRRHSRGNFSALCHGLIRHDEITHPTTDEKDADVWRSIGYAITGPIFLAFLLWLCDEAAKAKINRILFCARDGYSLAKGLNLLKEAWHFELEVEYIHTSRKVCNLANIREITPSSLDFLLMITPGLTLRDFVARCGCNPMEHEDALRALGFESLDTPLTTSAFGRFSDPRYRTMLVKWIDGIRDQLLESYRESRMLLLEYLEKLGIERKDTAVVDIGWNGTLIKSMQDIVQEGNKSATFRSFFFGTQTNAKGIELKGGKVRSFFFHLGQPRPRMNLVKECIELVELLFSAPHPTIIGLKRNADRIDPIYGVSEYTSEQRACLDIMRQAALKFIEDAALLCSPGSMLDSPAEFVEDSLRRLLRNPTKSEARAIGMIGHWHGYGDQGIARRLAWIPASNGKPISSLLTLSEAYNQSFWKRGFQVQISPFSFLLVRLLYLVNGVHVAFKSGTLWASIKWALFKIE